MDESSRRAHEGSGLGLAICKQLVELMGGTLGYRQRDEGGSRFHFLLPLNACERPQPAPGAEPREAAAPAPVARPAAERPVLLVDDNEVNQFVAVELLESLGLRVDVASSGADAIEAVLASDYGLVLMDCQMPGMDGYEATREIRRRRPGKLPIGAFTAHALAEEREKVLQAGMDDYLVKPLEPEQLAAVLARHLGTARASARPPARFAPPAPRPRSSPPAPAALPAAAELLKPGLRRPARAIESFLKRTPEELALLEQAAGAQRRDEVRRIAHKLKGSAGSLGASELWTLCERLQHQSTELATPELDALVRELGQAYQRVSRALRQESPSERGAP